MCSGLRWLLLDFVGDGFDEMDDGETSLDFSFEVSSSFSLVTDQTWFVLTGNCLGVKEFLTR